MNNICINTETNTFYTTEEKDEEKVHDEQMKTFYKDVARKVVQKKWAEQQLRLLKVQQKSDPKNMDLERRIKVYDKAIKNPKLLGLLKNKIQTKKSNIHNGRFARCSSMPHFAIPKKSERFLPRVDGNKKRRNTVLSSLQDEEDEDSKKLLFSPTRLGQKRCSLGASLNPESIKFFKESYPINIKKSGDQINWHKARIPSKFQPASSSMVSKKEAVKWTQSTKDKYRFIEKLLDKKKSPVRGTKAQDNQLLLEKIILDRKKKISKGIYL